jgi:drug/metabolite transporter (DMT)-like permease
MTTGRVSVAKATALIVTASCAFGSLSTLTVFITRSGLALVPAMFWRYLVAALALLLILRSQVGQVSRKHAVRLILIGGFGQASITYLSLRALDFLPVGPLAFLFYTYPAWIALIAAATGREDLTLPRLGALAIAMTGIVFMVGTTQSQPFSPVGVALALGTAFLYALYLPVLHKVQADTPAMVSSFYLILGVLAVFLVATLSHGGPRMPGSPATWIYLALLSLVSTVIAFSALMAGLRVLGSVRTSIVSTIEPFFTMMLGVVFLSEPMTGNIIAGGVLIAAAVLLLQWTERNREMTGVAG